MDPTGSNILDFVEIIKGLIGTSPVVALLGFLLYTARKDRKEELAEAKLERKSQQSAAKEERDADRAARQRQYEAIAALQTETVQVVRDNTTILGQVKSAMDTQTATMERVKYELVRTQGARAGSG